MKKNVQVNFHSTLFTVYTLSKKSSLNGLRFWKNFLWVFISKGTMSQCVLRFLLTSYIWQISKIILFFKACLDFFRTKNLIFESTKSKSFGLGHFFMIFPLGPWHRHCSCYGQGSQKSGKSKRKQKPAHFGIS